MLGGIIKNTSLRNFIGSIFQQNFLKAELAVNLAANNYFKFNQRDKVFYCISKISLQII